MNAPHTQTSPTVATATRRAWQSGLAGVSPVLLDAVVAVATAAAAAAAMGVADEPRARPPDALAYSLLLVAAAPLAFRRRWPPAALVATSAVSLVYFLHGYPGGPPTVILLVAVYSAAAAGRRWWALGVTAVFAGGGLGYRAMVEEEPIVGVLLNSALFVLVALLGETVASRRALNAEVAERLRRVEQERERDARRRVTEERMRIARELHDVMAHTVATMTVQAGVAADTLDDRPDDARAALHTVRASAREAMAQLRATVAVLRDGRDDTRLPTPGLADLDTLVETARLGGVALQVRSLPDSAAVPAAVQMTAFRIIQEAVTNVVRHAGATTAAVTLRRDGRTLVVTVDDDGRGPAGAVVAGHGLVGIRERAEALGGSATAGPGPAGGFRVEVRLPTGRTSR